MNGKSLLMSDAKWYRRRYDFGMCTLDYFCRHSYNVL